MALTGNKLFNLAVSDDTNLVPFVQRWVSELSDAPSFAVAVFSETGAALEAGTTWQELGRPSQIQVVLKATTESMTGELFDAIKDKCLQVQSILSKGQDPNCGVTESALAFAVRTSTAAMVDLLIRGNANVDLILAEGQSALRVAASKGRARCVDALLVAGADPNIWDPVRQCAPGHDASLQGNFAVVDCLLQFGSDPMPQDGDGDTLFTLAVPARTARFCIDRCFEELRWEDLLTRHLHSLLEFAPEPTLLQSAIRLQRQAKFIPCHLDPYDCHGGSSPSSTIFPQLPSFIDSEFSDSDPPSPRVPVEAFHRRIDMLEDLLGAYSSLLARQPNLFATLPSPFSPCADKVWHARVEERL